jgi:predicted Zn-dependent protease
MCRSIRLALFLSIFFLHSCSAFLVGVPTVVDEKLERYVSAIGLEIVAISEHRDRLANYQFRLADFARRDILGLSIGNQRIFISYELARLAYANSKHRWLLRHTLAHEIAHDVLGGDMAAPAGVRDSGAGLANRITASDLGLSSRVRFRPYSRWAELAADRRGMEYWNKLGWHCDHWVRLFTGFVERGYTGDADHPTQERLDQAIQICSEHQALTGALSAADTLSYPRQSWHSKVR